MKNFFLKTGLTLLCLLIGLGSAWGDTVTTYTFSSKSWAASPANWTSGKAGNGFTNNQGVQITNGTTGANATSPKSFSNVSKIVVTYCTNAKAGKGTVTLKVGSTEFGSQAITAPSSGGTTLRSFELNNSNNLSGSVNINVECSTNSIYIYSIDITETSGTSKTLSSIAVSGTPSKTEYHVGEAFNPAGLVVTGTYSDSSQEIITDNIEWTVTPATFTEVNAAASVSVVAKVGTIESSAYIVNGLTVAEAPSGLTVDFENALNTYTDWEFTNAEQSSITISAHGGTNYGTTGGKGSASIQTKNKIASPQSISCYVSKQSTNTSASEWKIQVSNDGTSWTDVATRDATNMGKGEWVEFSADLSSYSNVYVRIYYSGSTATRNIDDITLTYTPTDPDEDQPIPNFIKTSTLELVVGAPNYDIRNCLNIPSDYNTSTYAITTTINGLTQKDGEYACVYPYIAFSKAGEYMVHVVAAAMPGKYAQTEGNITVTVTNPAATITTISDLFTKATAVGSTKTDINLTLNSWVVSGVKGNNAYVTDGTNGFIIYQDSHGFTAGDVLSGTVACKVMLYNGSAEIVGLTSTTTGLTVSTSAEELTPTVISDLTTLSGVNTGALIKINNVQYDGTNFTDGTNSIMPYTSIMNTLPELTNGAYYNVTGVYVQYNSTKEIAPRSAEDIEEVQAEKYAINIASCENGTVTASLEEAAEGVEVTLTVTPDSGYQLSNLTVTNASTSEAITVTGNKFIMPAANVNVTATFEEEETPGTYTYNLVTDASTLAAGDVIVLGCAAKEKAAGAMGSNSYLTSVDATISNGILSSKDAIEITLGGAAGAWTLTTSDGQITTSAAKAFKLNTGTQKTWTISITDGTATITGGSYGYIQYNPSSPRFLNYTSGQTAIEIYKKTAAETKTLTSITLDGQTTEFTEGSTFEFGGTVTAHYDDESTKDVTSSATFSGYDMSVPDTEQTVTVSYTEGGVTKEASYNIIVNAVTKYTVTIVDPENGTLVVMHGDDVVKTGDKFAEGETLNITATPAEGYKFRNWQAVDGTTHTFTSGTTWTMSASDVTIKANFDLADQKYLISWNVNGTVTNQQVNANSALVAPTMTGKTLGTREFVGWTEDALVKNDTIPTYVTLGNATKDVTYYAVFADREEVTAAVPTSITAYADGNYYLVDKYVVEGVNHYYALDGNINQNNFIIPTDITAAVTENPDGSITIDESYPIIKDAMKYSMSLTVEGNDSTIVLRNLLTNKVINKVTGSSNANNLTNNEDAASWTHFYAMPHRDADDKKSLPEQIADPNRFTLSTSTSDNWESHAIFMQYSSWNSTYQVQDVSPRVKAYAVGNRGIQPPKAQMYSAGYLYFVPATPIALSNFATHEVSVSQYGSTTLCMPQDYVMPEGLTGKIVTANEAVDSKGDGYYTLTFQTKYTAGDIVPAGECLVLSGNQGSYYIAPGETTAKVSDDNLLHGDYAIDTTDSKLRFITIYDEENASSNFYYKLATDKNKENFGWYWGNTTGEPFIMTSNERAYLVIDKGTAGLIRGFALDEFGEEDITTFIEGLTNDEINKSGRIYNLQGQMVNKLQKGINIVNGKKVIR